MINTYASIAAYFICSFNNGRLCQSDLCNLIEILIIVIAII